MFWTHVRGTHPQTGQELDEYDCAIRWLPVLLIENAKETRQGAAAVESFRNQVVRQQEALDHADTTWLTSTSKRESLDGPH